MRRARPGVGSELLPVALILIGLAGTFGLVLNMHRKATATRSAARTPAQPAVVVVAPTSPAPRAPEEPLSPSPPVVVQPPPTPTEDPTRKALAPLNDQESEQRRAAREADRKAEALEKARQAAVADSQRWRRREALVRGQIDRLADQARSLELEADALAMERDALAREFDAAKAAVVKARAKNGGYAVMPNKGANGTWQRPVVIECRDGQAILQPKGLGFTMVDLSAGFSSRSSPFVVAVGRELIRAHNATSPDGSPVVPYIYFVIRPDGIRPYYEARGRLEPLGIAFGYELVEQDWEIEFPDFDALDTWDGSSSPRPRASNSTDGPGSVAGPRGGHGDEPGAGVGGGHTGTGNGSSQTAGAYGFVWPAERPGGVRGGDGLWPTRPPGAVGGRQGFVGDPAERGGPVAPGSGSGTGAGSGSPLPPLEVNDGATNSGGGLGSGAGGLDFPAPDQPGPRGTAPSSPGSPAVQPGLVPLNPLGLPRLDRPEPSGDARSGGQPGPGSSAQPFQPAGGREYDPRRLTEAPGVPPGMPQLPGDTRTTGTGPPPAGNLASGTPSPGSLNGTPPPSWVRIDPALLARLANGDRDDPERPPALPSNAMTGAGDAAGNPSASGGSAPAQGTAAPGIPSLGGGQSGQKGDYRPKASTTRNWSPMMTRAIEVPLDLVVACGPDGVVIHPGGYRLSRAALGKDDTLRRDLETIVRNHELIDAGVRPRPRVQFLVEPGGGETYSEARRQTVMAGLAWPVSIQVAGAQAPSVFPKERF